MRRIPVTLFALVLWGCGSMSAQEPVTLRTAMLAPEGSTWVNLLNEMADEVKTKTGGKVEFQFYPGGVAGDEKLVVKKLRIGQVHAAVFTNVGLGEILPEARILDIPYLYRNHQETDRVRALLEPRFEKALEEKGYIVLGWADAGAVYLFSSVPLRNVADLRQRKVWVWEGDAVAESTFRATGVGPIPLAFPDVLTSLQTGLIDTVYVSPIAAIALQWFSKVKTISDMPILDAVSVLVVAKKSWDKIPPDVQKIVMETARRHSEKQVPITRKENDDSIKVLQGKGLELVPADAAMRPEFDRIAEQVSKDLVGKLYSQETLDVVLKTLAEVRAGR